MALLPKCEFPASIHSLQQLSFDSTTKQQKGVWCGIQTWRMSGIRSLDPQPVSTLSLAQIVTISSALTHEEMSQHATKPSPNKTKVIPAFFAQTEKKDTRPQKNKEGDKMVEAGGVAWADMELLMKADLHLIGGKIDNMEAELLKKLSDLIKPLSDQTGQLNISLRAVSKVANGAMDLSLTQQEEIKALQKENETQTEKIAMLNKRWRFFNLKFRGIAENPEENND